MTTQITVFQDHGTVYAHGVPYNDDFRNQARALRGNWDPDQHHWAFRWATTEQVITAILQADLGHLLPANLTESMSPANPITAHCATIQTATKKLLTANRDGDQDRTQRAYAQLIGAAADLGEAIRQP